MLITPFSFPFDTILFQVYQTEPTHLLFVVRIFSLMLINYANGIEADI